MKIEWFVASLTAVGSPDRAERAILGVILAGCATLRCRKPLLNSNNFTQGHLVKIEWLSSDFMSPGSPDRAERAISVLILAGRVFGQSRSCLWPGGHFVV